MKPKEEEKLEPCIDCGRMTKPRVAHNWKTHEPYTIDICNDCWVSYMGVYPEDI